MLWVILCLVALLIGLSMFAKLQPSLPSELSFLKSNPPAAQSVTQVTPPAAANAQAIPDTSGIAAGWHLQVDGQDKELSKDFEEPVAGPGGQAYDKPTFYLTCYQGQLYARVNTRLRVTGLTPLTMDIPKMPAWHEAERQDWYSTSPTSLASQLVARGTVRATLAFAEVGTQSFTFNARGLATVARQLSPCHL